MNAYHATPTAVLYDLIVERAHYANVPLEYYDRDVSVALWDMGPLEMGVHIVNPTTALAVMSAALYVRLYPKGHHGPVVLDGGAAT